MAKLKSQQDIKCMREAGQLAAHALAFAGTLVKPGISTEDINIAVHKYIVDNGAYPSPLNYRGYPKAICTSINEVICHGIPSKEVILKEGDIINIDVTVTLNQYFGDTSKTFCVGTVTDPERLLVLQVAAESLARALAITKHGIRTGDIGAEIQTYAEGCGCGVVRDFTGHGIGKIFQEEPFILHYGVKNTGIKLVRGMTFTIEPMINAGCWQGRTLADTWTTVTADGKPSAQFEHTIAISGEGIEILTALSDDSIMLRAIELGAIITNG